MMATRGRMTVSYDLRYASDHYPGVGTYAFRLLEALLALPSSAHFVVVWNPRLANGRFDLEVIRRHPRVTWVERPGLTLDLPGQWRLGRMLRRLRPSVFFSPFYLVPLSAGDCPLVLTLHDVLPLRHPDTHSRTAGLAFRLAVWGARWARQVVTVSEFSRDEIRALTGIRRLVVARPGASPVREGGTRPPSLPDGPFALVVGINKPHKNLETVAAAWSRLGPEPPLRLVSAGPEDGRYPGLERLAERHRAVGVTALGRVTEDELAWLYRQARLMLFPSTYEGFGSPLAEALAYGTPAAVADIPPLREIGDGAAAFVTPRDPEAWATAVRDLGADEGRRTAMRVASLKRAAELTYARTAETVLGLLEQVAGSRA